MTLRLRKKNLRVESAAACGRFAVPESFFLRSGSAFVRSGSAFFFLRGFACVSPVFTVALLASLALPFYSFAEKKSISDPSAAERHQSASAQFARAEEQRAALNNKNPDKRTLADYKQVLETYRRVYLITPHAQEVPDALEAVAELYSEMGERFGRSYFQSAVDTYQFLIREYPNSHLAPAAYLQTAKLQQDRLDDLAGANATYETFLKRFPHSTHKREVQEARAELALLQNSQSSDVGKRDLGKSAIARSAGSTGERAESTRSLNGRAETAREYAAESAQPASKPSNLSNASNASNEYVLVPKVNGRPPQIRKISTQATSDSTKVEIDLDGAVQYTSGRIANPDRIFFDLQAAKLPPQVARNILKPEGTVLSAVRVAQSRSGVVRIVLDVNGVADYSASLLGTSGKGGAARLVIALYSKADANARAIETAKTQDSGVNAPVRSEKAERAKTLGTDNVASEDASPVVAPDKAMPKSARADGEDPLIVPKDERKTASAKDAGNATVLPQPKNKLGLAKTGKGGVGVIQPASIPQPTRDGQSTLTRALGLKIGRIVIDAGHGGHDTGTIGPTGLMEKDLCLDVALRLGKIIQQRLPSSDVVYTRSDDTFIPLEERTHIANEAKADMFISIHANSSGNSDARGIETYYLNLKGSDEAMEVAARENSTSGQGIHELQDLVKQIARTEKIDESKEFAEDVQDSLAKRVQKAARPVKNRGVRKAPFVVLIGADMPSILTEISFLSNPADEKMLKQPEHRQRVAEGIYQGVASYLQSLNSMGVNQTASPMPKRTDTSAAVQDSRNQN